MKTHELANAMSVLSRILKGAPNVDLKDLTILSPLAINGDDSADAALNLSTMVALSRITKQRWREMITEWGLPIEVPTTYSVRDTIGKVLRYLEDHPEELKRLQDGVASTSKRASPELMKALSILLSGDKE